MDIGKKFIIQSYKHDGSIHRSWDEAVLLDETDDYLVFGNNKTKVTESDGRSWNTKEEAILYFYKNNWFNIIGQLKKDGIYYYCNIASPFILEDGAIKYIDYDLDLRVFPNGTYKVLDKGEYKYHKSRMNYPDDLDLVLKNELNVLINMHKKGDKAFDTANNLEYKEKYEKIVKNVLTSQS